MTMSVHATAMRFQTFQNPGPWLVRECVWQQCCQSMRGEGPDLLVLRAVRDGSGTRSAMLETTGMAEEEATLDTWPGTQRNDDVCRSAPMRGGRRFVLPMARPGDLLALPMLAKACAEPDIVIADRRIPGSCRPHLLQADLALLRQAGALPST